MTTILTIYTIFSYFFVFALYVKNRVNKWDVILSPITVPFTLAAIVDHLSKIKTKEELSGIEIDLLHLKETEQDQLKNLDDFLQDISEFLILKDIYPEQSDELATIEAKNLLKKYKIYKNE